MLPMVQVALLFTKLTAHTLCVLNAEAPSQTKRLYLQPRCERVF